MDSSILKEVAVQWLRFDRQMPYVATEVGHWYADVFGASDKCTIEIETKITNGDLRVDFQKPKHRFYADPAHTDLLPCEREFIPSYFFFLVPKSLEDFAVRLCRENRPSYGVIVFDPFGQTSGQRLHIAKRSKRLHSNSITDVTKTTIAKRISSELAGMYALKNQLTEMRGLIWQKLKCLEPNENRELISDDDVLPEVPPVRQMVIL